MNSESNISKAVGPRVTDTTGPSGAVVVDENGLLLTGDPEFVETYVNRLTAFAKDAYDVTDVSKKSLVDIAAAAAAVVGITASGGQYVRLSPQTITKMANAELIGGSEPGFFLSTLRDESTKAFSGQMQWQPVALNHAQMLNVQMAMMTVALRTAIAHVEKAVAAVDKKVDAVLKLAKADRTGDIVGLYRTLVRLTAQFDETARLSQADWDSIAAIGPELDQATSKLRSFIKQCLDDFDPGASIGERSDYLSALVKRLFGLQSALTRSAS
ncbi:hypothetical protein GCM10010528_23800 [Gordonia defluvii]|uniref:Uncharacterized protein n=1 Tax=Gordonia defluvii TaxID=283718 RepID=A0ABP6LKG4_9ACTN